MTDSSSAPSAAQLLEASVLIDTNSVSVRPMPEFSWIAEINPVSRQKIHILHQQFEIVSPNSYKREWRRVPRFPTLEAANAALSVG